MSAVLIPTKRGLPARIWRRIRIAWLRLEISHAEAYMAAAIADAEAAGQPLDTSAFRRDIGAKRCELITLETA